MSPITAELKDLPADFSYTAVLIAKNAFGSSQSEPASICELICGLDSCIPCELVLLRNISDTRYQVIVTKHVSIIPIALKHALHTASKSF